LSPLWVNVLLPAPWRQGVANWKARTGVEGKGETTQNQWRIFKKIIIYKIGGFNFNKLSNCVC
jgi:hypothetical protein